MLFAAVSRRPLEIREKTPTRAWLKQTLGVAFVSHGRKKYKDLLDLVKTLALFKRFVDDRLELMLGNAHYPPYIYDPRSNARDTSGMYPTNVLTASGTIVPLPPEYETVCQAGLCVHYLGFWLKIDIHCKRIFTSLYDKRDGRPEFEDTPNFPHFESRLHSNIKFPSNRLPARVFR